MSYIVTKYPQGTFSWADIFSTDAPKSKDFLNKLFDWKSKDMPTSQGIDYTIFTMDGHDVAGLSPMPKQMEGASSHWKNYISVDNIEATLKKVEEAGGKVLMPTMDVMTAGKTAGIQDPTGAKLMLWEAKDHIGAGLVNTIGAMGWNELHTNDIDKAKEFYSEILGWTYDFDKKSGYSIIKNGGRMNGGMMTIQKEWGEVPPSWVVYFTVENIEKTVARAKKLGGKTHSEVMEASGVGKFAVIAEPTGTVFTVIELAVEPDEWKD